MFICISYTNWPYLRLEAAKGDSRWDALVISPRDGYFDPMEFYYAPSSEPRGEDDVVASPNAFNASSVPVGSVLSGRISGSTLGFFLQSEKPLMQRKSADGWWQSYGFRAGRAKAPIHNPPAQTKAGDLFTERQTKYSKSSYGTRKATRLSSVISIDWADQVLRGIGARPISCGRTDAFPYPEEKGSISRWMYSPICQAVLAFPEFLVWMSSVLFGAQGLDVGILFLISERRPLSFNPPEEKRKFFFTRVASGRIAGKIA
ncbi:hypothetical protein Tco_1576439 [Tanacetum coccineum]